MKALLCILIPLTCFAQNPSYSDTLILKGDKVFFCNVIELNEEIVKIEYGDTGYGSSSGIVNVKKIILGNKGRVFEEGSGFLMDIDQLRQFIKTRNQKRKEALEKQRKEEEARKEKERKVREKREKARDEAKKNVQRQKNNITDRPAEDTEYFRWSFGAYYTPYYSGKIYYYYENSGYHSNVYIKSYADIESFFEGQFSYALLSQLRITLDIGYTAYYKKERFEWHSRYTDNEDNNDGGNVETSGLDLFIINLGLKYYLSNLCAQKVSAFILAGAGKQFAFATDKTKSLYPEENPSPTQYDNNKSEFTEGMNSPLNLSLGFGVEYLFNESLSLYSSIRFHYSRFNATYKYREVSDNRTYTYQKEYTKSDIVTRVGLGLNFYF